MQGWRGTLLSVVPAPKPNPTPPTSRAALLPTIATGMPMGYEQLQAQPWQEFPEKLVSPVQWQVDKTLGWRPRLVRRPFPTVDGEQVVWAPSPQALLQSFPQRFLVNFGCALGGPCQQGAEVVHAAA